MENRQHDRSKNQQLQGGTEAVATRTEVFVFSEGNAQRVPETPAGSGAARPQVHRLRFISHVVGPALRSPRTGLSRGLPACWHFLLQTVLPSGLSPTRLRGFSIHTLAELKVEQKTKKQTMYW